MISFSRLDEHLGIVEYDIDLSKWPDSQRSIVSELIGYVFTEHADEHIFHDVSPGGAHYSIADGEGEQANKIFLSKEEVDANPRAALLVSMLGNVCRTRDGNGNMCGFPLPCPTHG